MILILNIFLFLNLIVDRVILEIRLTISDMAQYHSMLSPCLSECNLAGKLDENFPPEVCQGADRYCTSCFRSNAEIGHWRQMTEQECLAALQFAFIRKTNAPE